MKIRRIIFLTVAILSLASLVFFITLNSVDSWKTSDTSELVFEKSMKSIDSILVANDKTPAKFKEFKKSVADLSLHELESEYFRCVNSNQAVGSEEYYIREIVERYSKELSANDKKIYTKMLNNLGYIYNDKSNPAAAYKILKTGYEIAKIYDTKRSTWPAYMCNMAYIFFTYGDVNQADKLFSQALDMAFSPDFVQDEQRRVESARIYTFIEYVHFLWMINKLDTPRSRKYLETCKLPTSMQEFSPYARYLQKAARAYNNKDYYVAKAELDSAANSVTYKYIDPNIYNICFLQKAKSLYQAGDYAGMRSELQEVEKLVQESNSTYLMPYLYKGFATCSFCEGDSIEGKIMLARGLALQDSLFNSSNYAALRDVQSDWDKTWSDIKIEQANRYYLWIILSLIVFIMSASAFIVSLVVKRKPEMASAQAAERQKVAPKGNDGVRTCGAGKEPERQMPASESLSGTPEAEDTDEEADSETDEETDSDEAAENEDADGDEDTDGKLRALYPEICKAVENNRNIYDLDYSINTLAAEMRVSSRQISRAVNIYGGKNFSSFLAEYRVREACRILDEARTPLERPTMDALAQMVGYKSRAHLSRVFKAMTGVSPTEYMSGSGSTENSGE